MSTRLDGRTIGVAIDGSAAGRRALAWAASAAPPGDRLVVLHVGDVTAAPDGVTATAFGQQLLTDALADLAERDAHLPVSVELLNGNPADAIVGRSSSLDLLVLGRARHVVPSLLPGAVAGHVLGRAACPVVLVSDEPAAPTGAPVVVGVSDSLGGFAALHFAFGEAQRRGGPLRAVRVWAPHDAGHTYGVSVPGLPSWEWELAERSMLTAVVDAVRGEYPAVAVATELLRGPVEVELEAASRTAALLVVGTRRQDGAHLPRLGPTASWVARHLTVPVAVVGHTPLAPDPGPTSEPALAGTPAPSPE